MEAFQNTTATKKIFNLNKRIRAVSGGTSASKTISILVWLIDYAQSTNNELISVVSESFPHLSGGAMLDFENIMKLHGYWEDKRWVKNPKAVYTFETGSKIEFISVDTFGKAHGPRRDILFVNECNNLTYNIVDQLITRTRKIVWLDWNPSEEFWFYTEILGKRDDVDFITLTYLDNEALEPITVKEIESHKDNKMWWQVYGLGQLGEIKTRIYTGWQIIDSIPHEAKLVRYGLDFGYSNDPTAIIAIYSYNGGFIFDEVCYLKGLSNKQISDILINQNNSTMVIADSSEPKSIDEIRQHGINILGVKKGKDSVRFGIKVVQNQRISVTVRSTNIIKEYRNYMWETNKNGEILTSPIDLWNHGLDAVRYGLSTIVKPIEIKKQHRQQVVPTTRFEGTIDPNMKSDEVTEAELAKM